MVRWLSKWLLPMALLGGVALVAGCGTVRGPAAPTPPGRHRYPPPAATPPREPPPGRPFAATPLAYTTAVPNPPDLRTRVRGANLLICVLDAARADHFRAYGYPRPTTPNFDRLAREGLLFEQHFSQVTETLPSTLSLLTGLYPDTHGATSNGFPRPPGSAPFLTLEAFLARAGYATYSLSGSSLASPIFRVCDDFQHRSYPKGKEASSLSPDALLREVRSVLPEWRRQPFFAYLHVHPPHAPYHVPERFQRPFQDQSPPRHWRISGAFTAADPPGPFEPNSTAEWANLYDANLQWADAFLGDLERMLREADLLDRTLLLITADHGEALREHGLAFHAWCPYDEAMHIPLLMRFPDGPAGRVRALTQTIDVFPTLLDLYGIRPAPVQGRSLLPLLTGQAREANPYLFARTAGAGPCYVVRGPHATLLLWENGQQRALYDMDVDPWQTKDIYAQQRGRALPLEQAFFAFARSQRYPPPGFLGPPRSRPEVPPAKPLTAEQERALHSLGYLK